MKHSGTPKSSNRLLSNAWLLRGISSIPGELVLASGTVSFTAFNTGSAWPWQLRKLERLVGAEGIAQSIDDGQRSLVLQWPVDSLQAWCPWYYFGGGIKLRRGDLVLRFSLAEPANMRARAPGTDILNAIEGVDQVRVMRSLGARWLAALAASIRVNEHNA
jgi:hypothetical protein